MNKDKSLEMLRNIIDEIVPSSTNTAFGTATIEQPQQHFFLVPPIDKEARATSHDDGLIWDYTKWDKGFKATLTSIQARQDVLTVPEFPVLYRRSTTSDDLKHFKTKHEDLVANDAGFQVWRQLDEEDREAIYQDAKKSRRNAICLEFARDVHAEVQNNMSDRATTLITSISDIIFAYRERTKDEISKKLREQRDQRASVQHQKSSNSSKSRVDKDRNDISTMTR